MRSVIGPLTCYYYAPKADVKLSDSGMRRAETGTLKTAYIEQRSEFKEANLREGEAATEALLYFLEEKKSRLPPMGIQLIIYGLPKLIHQIRQRAPAVIPKPQPLPQLLGNAQQND